jgi:phosphate transport system permease protein
MVAVYFLTLAVLVAGAFVIGRSKAVSVGRGNYAQMHSLPTYHGLLLSAMVFVPMILIFIVGNPLVGTLATSQALSQLPSDIQADAVSRATALRDVTNLAAGQHMGDASPAVQAAAETYQNTTVMGSWIVYGLGVAAALLAVQIGLGRISMSYRARNRFEKFVKVILLASAAVAVLTTIGILFSVSFETFRFFFDPSLKGRPTVTEFLFGTEWNPQAALRACGSG